MADSPSQPIDEARRRQFESAWVAGDPPPIEACLPPRDDPLYPGTLAELVQIDLEFRWKTRNSADVEAPRIEDYVLRFPILRQRPTLLELLEEEYRIRHRFGDRPSRDEYLERFPDVVESHTEITPSETLHPAPATTRPAAAGERLGHYRLVAEHARGGFGSVWRATDEKFGREIAIKQLRGPLTQRQEFRRRFLNEARVTARLAHPGVVPVYDMGEAGDDLVYYAMKLVRGGTLADAIAALHARRDAPGEYAIEHRRLLNAFVFVCQTMEYAHARGVIHRDLKPQNIVLSDYGETVVLDWGLAKVVADDDAEPLPATGDLAPNVTRQGTVQGTPAYMSPEQAAGRVDAIDERSDVYSLGVILYQLLTGRVPFDGDTGDEVIARVIEGRPRRPRALADVAPALEAICLRAMAARREQRYPTVAALTRDLQRHLADEPVSAHVEPMRARVGRWLRRHRILVTGLAAAMIVALVSLAVLAIVLGAANSRERQERERAAANFALARDAVGRYFLRVSQDPRLRAVGLAQLRRDLLEEAGEFYRRFAEQRGDDPRVREERALALRQLGLITEETESPEAALDRYREAGEILAELTEQHPDERGFRIDLADHHNVLGNALKELTRYAEAETSYRRALELYESLHGDGNAEVDANRAAVFNNLAIVCENTGRMAEAETYYRDALQTQRQLHDGAADARFKVRVARTLQNLGMLLLRTGRLDEAAATDREALDLCEELINEQPDEPSHPKMRAMLQHNLAVVVRRQGHQDEALELYGQALAARRELVRTHVGVPGYLHELAATLGNLGVVHFDRGEYEKSRQLLMEARELRLQLRELQPDVSVHEYDLAGIHINLGNILNREKAWQDAQAEFATAKTIDEDLAARFPDELLYLYDAGAANFMMAIAVHNAGPAADALPHYERAAGWFEKVLQRAPDYIGARTQLRVCSKYRALLEDSLGHHAEAATHWTRAIELAEGEERDGFVYQRALSLGRSGDAGAAAELAATWAEGATGERAFQAAVLHVIAANASAEAARDDHASAAVTLLEQARADGFFASPELRKVLESEAEFDVLRERSDFQAILERLGDK